MPNIPFQPLPGETILYRTRSNRKWIIFAWKILSGLIIVIILTFLVYSLLGNSTESLLSNHLPFWMAKLLTVLLFVGVFPLAGTAMVAEDIVSTCVGEFVLTDQRVWVRGSPFAWSRNATNLDDIQSMIWRRDAVFIRQKSSQKIQVHIFSDGEKFVKAYQQFKEKSQMD